MGWGKKAAVALGTLWISALLLPCVGAYIDAGRSEHEATMAQAKLSLLAAGSRVCERGEGEISATNPYAAIMYDMNCTEAGLRGQVNVASAEAQGRRFLSGIFFAIAVIPPLLIWMAARAVSRSAWWAQRRVRAQQAGGLFQRAAASAVGAWAVIVVAVGVFMDSAYHSLDGDDLVFLSKLFIVPLVAAVLIALLVAWARRPSGSVGKDGNGAAERHS